MREDLSDYLKRLDRLGEPGLVFGPTIDVEAMRSALEAAFPGRHVFTLRANGPLEPKPEEIQESFRNSFEGKGVLAIVVGSTASAPLMKMLEQVCEDEGVYQEKDGGGWERRKPPTGWRMVVLAEAADLAAIPPQLSVLFAAPFAL